VKRHGASAGEDPMALLLLAPGRVALHDRTVIAVDGGHLASLKKRTAKEIILTSPYRRTAGLRDRKL
jgi:hypothetical protein